MPFRDYHFKVLFLILSKLGYSWADKLSHLSYGMVDLPTGRMKSREGTVVDADDLLDEMEATAKRLSEELGKVDGLSAAEQADLYKTLPMTEGTGAVSRNRTDGVSRPTSVPTGTGARSGGTKTSMASLPKGVTSPVSW